MLRKSTTALVLSLALITFPTAPDPAGASQAIFENMTGKWRGKGLVKASPKGKDESIRCRMNNKLDNDTRIDLSGSCAVSGFVFSLGGFIEQSAILFVLMIAEQPKFPKVVDLSIDYLSAGHYRDSFAQCRALRVGRRLANIQVSAWQDKKEQPIATARANLLL